MRILRWAWCEIDRISVILVSLVFGIIIAAGQVFTGLIGMAALIGLWHISDMIRMKVREAEGGPFVITIKFHHLLLAVGLIAMSLLVVRAVLK